MPAKAALQIEHQLPAWKLSLALPPTPPLSHAATQCEIGLQGAFSTEKNGRGGAAEHALAIYSLQSDTLGSESQLYYLLAV